MNKYKRLGKNTLLVFIGNAGSKLIGLVMLPFYTSWLSVEDYGVTDIINVYVSFLVSIVSCCIAESIFIFPKGQKVEKQKQYFSSGIVFVLQAFFVSFLLFGTVDFVSSIYGFSNSFTDYLWLIYGLMAATLLQQFFQQFTRSIDKMIVYGMAGIVLTLLTAICSFILIPLKGVVGYVLSLILWLIYGLMAATLLQQFFQQFTRSIDKMIVYGMAGIVLTLLTAICSFILIPLKGVVGYVLSLILANLFTGVYSFFFSGSYKYCSPGSVNNEYCREMLQYSVPLIPNGVMWWLVNALNRPIMETYVGLHGIGLFAVANKFPGIIAMIFTIFVSSWQISVLEEYGKDGYASFYNKIFRGVLLILLVLLVIVTFISKWLVSFFTSSDYLDAWIYIPVLTLGIFFSCVSGLAGSTFSAVRKSRYFFYSSVYGGLSSIVFNFLLIPLWGIWGAVLSVVLSFMVMSVSRVAYSWTYVKLTHIPRLLLMLLLTCIYIVSVCLTGSANSLVAGFITIGLLLLLNCDLLHLLKRKIIKRYIAK